MTKGMKLEGRRFLKHGLMAVIVAGLAGCAKLPVLNAPVGVSISPSEGTGSKADLTAVFSDAKGAGNITVAGVLINDQVTGANACYVMIVPPFKSLRLVKDTGNESLALSFDGRSKVQNSQCTVFANGSSITRKGNELILKASIEFSSDFGGSKDIYLYAENTQGGKSPMTPAKGAWVIP